MRRRIVQQVIDRIRHAAAARIEHADRAEHRGQAADRAGRDAADRFSKSREQHAHFRQRRRARIDAGWHRRARRLHDPALAREAESARLVQRDHRVRVTGAGADGKLDVDGNAPQLGLDPRPGRAARVGSADEPPVRSPDAAMHRHVAGRLEMRTRVVDVQRAEIELRPPVERRIAGRRSPGRRGHADREVEIGGQRGRTIRASLRTLGEAGRDDRRHRAPDRGLTHHAERRVHVQTGARGAGQRRRRLQLARRIVEREQGDQSVHQPSPVREIRIVCDVVGVERQEPLEQPQRVGRGIVVEHAERHEPERRAELHEIGDSRDGIGRASCRVTGGRLGNDDEPAGETGERIEQTLKTLRLAGDAVRIARCEPAGQAAAERDVPLARRRCRRYERGRCETRGREIDEPIGRDVRPGHLVGRRNGDANDRRRRAAEQLFDVDAPDVAVLREVGESLDGHARRIGFRRDDAAVGPAPARDERLESRRDVGPAVDQRPDVVGDDRFVSQRVGQCRRAQACETGAPHLQPRRRDRDAAVRTVGSDPDDEMREAGAARERHAPWIGRPARSFDDSRNAGLRATEKPRQKRERLQQQIVVVDRKTAKPRFERRDRIDDDIAQAQMHFDIARALTSDPPERADEIDEKRRTRARRKRAEERLDAIPTLAVERDVPGTVDDGNRNEQRAVAQIDGQIRRGELGAEPGRRRPARGEADAVGGDRQRRRREYGLRQSPRAQAEARGDAGKERGTSRGQIDLDRRHEHARLDARTALADRVHDEPHRRAETEPIAGHPGVELDRTGNRDAPRIRFGARAIDGQRGLRRIRDQIAQRRDDDRHNRGVAGDDGVPVIGDGAERIREKVAEIECRNFRMPGGRAETEQHADRVGRRSEQPEELIRNVAEHGAADFGNRVRA